ncbi:FCD domain-containing protein [Mesorhizobium sp. M2A.F.Ca.ET.042.01.1.1]|nr:FCD domain-containing protein [Mesorhizobium sp. M2A.F.Ca.ET.042.01.1.1]
MEERRATYCSEHQLALDALLARDSEAASDAMPAHLRTIERNLLGR